MKSDEIREKIFELEETDLDEAIPGQMTIDDLMEGNNESN